MKSLSDEGTTPRRSRLGKALDMLAPAIVFMALVFAVLVALIPT